MEGAGVRALPWFRATVCGALLAFAAPGLARVVQIKEDQNARITRFRMVPPEEIEGLRGERLRAKVTRYTRIIAPMPREVTVEWLVFAECDERLIMTPQPLTPGMTSLQISCTR